MFTKDDASRTQQEFWTTFGKYMRPVPSAEGAKINWINYNTQLKGVYFRMSTGVKSASIYISIEQTDASIRELYFEQFLQYRTLLQEELQEEWDWQKEIFADGKFVSRISKELSGASVMDKNHWPDLISFFKPRIIGLDAFWENAKYGFESLK